MRLAVTHGDPIDLEFEPVLHRVINTSSGIHINRAKQNSFSMRRVAG